jgi:glycosyltransferase involved in cell wall biosynthesis
MKLLISTYACAPNQGSENAVGWNWVTEAHRLGHRVCALTSSVHRQAIESACRDDPDLGGIHWVFPEIRSWPLRRSVEPKWERTYNLLWQIAALRHARELQGKMEFDAIHHLTWGGVRAPTFLGSLGVPLIMGPLGGGETSPLCLRDGLRLKARVTEAIRDLSNATITFNPLVRGGLTSAAVISIKTPATRRLLSRSMQERSIDFLELGLRRAQIGTPRGAQQMPPRLLYAGRLLYWKGVHIAIRALANLVQRIPEARLTIVGRGPEEGRLKAEAVAFHLEENIEFISWLPQPQLYDLYSSHNLLVFPSLHDSSGNVVIEALSRGLPVMCLDLGGPAEIVTPDSGIIVGTEGRNTAQVAETMADELVRIFADPARLAALSDGAIARANQFILSDRVGKFYDRAAGLIGSSTKEPIRHSKQNQDWVVSRYRGTNAE